jgi:FkbM family methyltransferase
MFAAFGFEFKRLGLYPELSLADGGWVSFQNLIEYQILKKGKTYRMLQIGCNDGITSDPVHSLLEKYDFEAILIEPQNKSYESLVQLHKNRPSTIILRYAIGKNDGVQDFYSIREDELSLFPGIESSHFGLLKDQLIKQLATVRPDMTNYMDHVQISEVQTRNINSLLQELQIDTLDLLQIDTEGYDAEIILSLNLDVWSPNVINFEHSNLSTQVKNKLYKLLKSHGYLLVLHDKTSGDSTAYKSKIFLNS